MAQLNLANLLDEGKGVAKSGEEAAKYYRKAAEQGVPHAEFAMAVYYADGEGVPQDFVEAYKWTALAAAHGVKEAAAFQPILEKKLAPEQKTKAQELVQSLLAGNPGKPAGP